VSSRRGVKTTTGCGILFAQPLGGEESEVLEKEFPPEEKEEEDEPLHACINVAEQQHIPRSWSCCGRRGHGRGLEESGYYRSWYEPTAFVPW
jgi:hypothetical protein